MLRIGLNPYGLAYAVGLQGAGTPRVNPAPIGLDGFVGVAREIRARCLEIHDGWLDGMTAVDLARLRDRCIADGMTPVVSVGLTQTAGETLESAIGHARAVGAALIRLGLTPVLEGSRATWGARWYEMVAHARETLRREARRAADAGLEIAIEDHQDFGGEELVAMAEDAAPNVGVVFDTGNPFAVGEDPVAFARRAAHRIRHVHLKDYRAQFTAEGYRLVRCAIGDGAVPFDELWHVLGGEDLTASIEPGALEARHIRLFRPEWWQGYPPREASELGSAIGRLRRRQLADDEPFATPWERGAAPAEIVAYELAQIRRSAANMMK